MRSPDETLSTSPSEEAFKLEIPVSKVPIEDASSSVPVDDGHYKFK